MLSTDDHFTGGSLKRGSAVRINRDSSYRFFLSTHYSEDVFIQVYDSHDEQSCHEPYKCEGDGSHSYRLVTSEIKGFILSGEFFVIVV